MINRSWVIVKSGTYINILTILFICGGILFQIALNAQDVKIGDQVWMSKNLDVETFRNGDLIKQANTIEEWRQLYNSKIPAWCYYNFDIANGKTYGKLYNWFAVIDEKGIAPKGYHIPTEDEWNILTNKLGGWRVAGLKLKSKKGWLDWSGRSKGNGNNSSKFSALPSGFLWLDDMGGGFKELGNSAYLWSSTPDSPYSTRIKNIFSFSDWIQENQYVNRNYGLAIRCVKD